MNPATQSAFGLYLVLTEPVAGYEACAEAAVEAGLRYVQLRRKNKPRTETLDIARRLRRITAGSATLFIVNDDVEIAADCDADGVHLGQDDMSIAAARVRWPAPGKVFGLSTHNEEQERRARELAPDYIGVGPVFATPTKEQPDPILGLERMGRIVRASPLTTVPIGGIDRRNLPEILRRGAVNFCVLRAVNLDPDPLSSISALQAIWRAHLAAQ
jgi:thiamine-phosphate pyrophosphorylase